jgi:hypothetical protein
VLYALLLPDAVVHAVVGDDSRGMLVLIAYVAFSVMYSIYASRLPMQDGLLRMATMLLSMPLIALLASSIQAGFRNLFQQTFTSSPRTFKVPQNVRAHVRAGSIDVKAYTRNMPKTVTDVSVSTQVSSANVGMAASVISRKSVDKATAPADDGEA